MEQVRQFVFEPGNEPYWITGVQESHMLSVRPIGRGTQVQRIGKFLGKLVIYNMEMIQYDPEDSLTWLSMNAPIPMQVNYKVLKSAEDITIFKQTFSAETKGMKKLLDIFFQPMMKNNISRDMNHLKLLLEKK